MLADLKKHQRRDYFGCEQRLPWYWTEEAAPWISQQLGLLVFHIAVRFWVVCWCSQCLLTVSGNLLPHTVTPLDVTTWHVAADRPRTFYTLQNARQQHCKHNSDSEQQVSSLRDIALFTADKCFQHDHTLSFGCWTGVTESVSIVTLHYVI